MSEVTNNLPVPAESQPATPAELTPEQRLDRLLHPGRYRITNLDLEGDYGKAIAIKSMSEADADLAKMAGKEFEVEGYVGHVVPITLQDTGEIVQRIRIILVSPQGETVAWTSEITTRYWGMILATYGAGPWQPPLKVKFTAHKGKQQGNWYSIDMPLPPKPGQPKKESSHAKKAPQ